MNDELQPLLARLEALIANLDAGQRRQLTVELARSLRASQARRIRDNRNPDGSAFAPRKPQPQLRARRGGLRMFTRLHRTRWLKPRGTPDEASLSFAGFADQVARAHQYGLRDRVNRYGTQAQYPARQLLGLTDDELQTVERIIIGHLSR